jgi:hypothetical protein
VHSLASIESARASTGVQLNALDAEAESHEDELRAALERRQRQSARQEGLIERARVVDSALQQSERALATIDAECAACATECDALSAQRGSADAVAVDGDERGAERLAEARRRMQELEAARKKAQDADALCAIDRVRLPCGYSINSTTLRQSEICFSGGMPLNHIRAILYSLSV